MHLRLWLGLAIVAGLLLAPLGDPEGWVAPAGLLLAVLAVGCLLAVGSNPLATRAFAAIALLALGLAAFGFGGQRLSAIDAGALMAEPGTELNVEGYVLSPPRQSAEGWRLRFGSPAGRALVVTAELPADVDPGTGLKVVGVVAQPGDWEESMLRVGGIHRRIEARKVERSGEVRGGLQGVADDVRRRAERALTGGNDAGTGELVAGLVLGQDDAIEATTADNFRRTGLAHLLAVSGQNVMLLIALGAVVFAAVGTGWRLRLLMLAILVGVYVLVTGAGPSIQRAGVMGVAGLAAAMAGRPASRWYIFTLAAIATLAINPRAIGDVGWQLSFAAVAGIALWSAPLSRAIAGDGGGLRAIVSGGLALTIAATLATAPLMAHHFGVVSMASLPANMLAMPAVAPVMWAGMLAATIGQLAWLAPLGWLAEGFGSLAGIGARYIASVAAWFSPRSWSQIDVRLGMAGVVAGYVCLGLVMFPGIGALGRRRGMWLRAGRLRAGLLIALCLAAVAVAGSQVVTGDGPGHLLPDHARLTVVDVGQGDALLIQDTEGAVLVDTGPPGTGLVAKLRAYGVGSLRAFVATHGDLDHVGGLEELLAAMPVGELLVGSPDRAVEALARHHGVPVVLIGTGSRLAFGEQIKAEVLWPPPAQDEPSADARNARSLVLSLRIGNFDALLTGDAEFAEAGYRLPGAVEVLKLPHHGSEDPGLAPALAVLQPALAIASAGEDNRFGHPAADVVGTLAEAGVDLRRTDVDGDVVVTTDGRRWWIGG